LPRQGRGSTPSNPPWQGRGSSPSGKLPSPDRRSSGRISSGPISSGRNTPSDATIAPDAGNAPQFPAWWIVVAHTLGAAAIGGLDAARLGSVGLALAVVPVFAAMGLFVGTIVAALERAVGHRRWWVASSVLTAPTLIVSIPVVRSLFEGAYAQTLPFATAAPYAGPAAIWLGSAIVVAIGRRILRAGDLTSRAIVVLALAGAIGGIVWAERHVLGTGYPTAHLGATLALIVLVGIGVRVTRRTGVSYLFAAVITGLTIGGAIIACLGGLSSPNDRQLLATHGRQSRDVIGLWRSVLDLDRDGASVVLGGGDCDDQDAARHPGAIDKPGDGFDQDCDGKDAVMAPVAEVQTPKGTDLASWRATPEVAKILERTRSMHVLVISVDALRADLLAPGALDREDFPAITKLLSESVWFTRAFAPASGTDISLGTFLTGRFDPFQVHAKTLPEALQAAGRKTFAAIPGEVLRYAGEPLLARGIDKLVKVHTDWGKADIGDHVSAPATTAEGLKALDDLGDKPGFVWVHYFDVHESHQIDVPKRLRDAVHAGTSKKEHVYRALLRAIDDEIGRLRDELVKRNLADRTIIVFASDHGESLGEDPRLLETHGKVTYAPLVRVPLAFHIPGVAPAMRTEQVSHVDLAPTLLALAGVAPTDMTLDGIDLVPVLLDAPEAVRPPHRPIAIHEELQWSLVDWPHQLIVRPADNVVELYDLEKDPTQTEDLSTALPDLVSRLKARFAEFPRVAVDRTTKGRSAREELARQRPNRTP
jgi:arylsulfatase A-like enzyme